MVIPGGSFQKWPNEEERERCHRKSTHSLVSDQNPTFSCGLSITMYYLFISTDFHHVIGKVNRPHQTQCAHPSNTLEAFLHDKVISLTLTLPAPDMGSIPTAGVSVSLPHFTLFFLKKNTAVLRKPIVNTIPVRSNKSPRARRALSNRRIVPKSKNRNPTACWIKKKETGG